MNERVKVRFSGDPLVRIIHVPTMFPLEAKPRRDNEGLLGSCGKPTHDDYVIHHIESGLCGLQYVHYKFQGRK